MATIYICSNTETLCDGYCEGIDTSDRDAIAEAGIDAAIAALVPAESNGHKVTLASLFSDWNGGKYREQCGKIVAGVRYGYAVPYIATLEENPSPELIAWMDKASGACASALAGAADDQRASDAAHASESE